MPTDGQAVDARSTGDGAPDIRLSGVVKSYGSVAAVDGIDLEVAAGEFFTLLGPSGSGKTTCLRMIAGFERPDSGTVSLAGGEVTNLPPQERDVNTVFQDYALFPHMSVAENVAYGLKVKGVAKGERAERVREALELVRLGEFGDRAPGKLSGGQRQRVALARALINRPRVLLLDEPLGALDFKLRQELQVELKRIQVEVGITFVYVTHDQDEALTMSDRIAVMNAGQIAQIGTPREVYEQPNSRFVAGFVGVSNLLDLPVAEVRDGVAVLDAGPRDRVEVPCTSATAAKRAVVTVRPERISFGEGDECVAHGTVRESLYAGPTTRWVIDLDSGGTLIVMRESGRPGEGGATGEPVALSWPRNGTRLIETTQEGDAG